MYQDESQTYDTLLRYTLKFIAIVIALLLILGSIRAVGQNISNQDHRAETAQAEKASRFWSAVAGTPQNLTVGSKLAHDISIRMQDPVALRAFQGNSNAYGGVVDDIGFDPFNEQGLDCRECGPLSTDTISKVEQIKVGNIDSVLESIKVPVVNTGYHVTPFDLSFASLIYALWFVVFPLSMAAAHFWAYEEGVIRTHFGDLRYIYAATSTKIWLTLLCPTYMSYCWVKVWLTKRTLNRKVRTTFPDHMRLIDEVDQSLAALPSYKPAVIEIREARDKVVSELRNQAVDGTSTNDAELEKCMEYLTGIKTFLDARHEYLHSDNGADWPAQLEKAEEKTSARN